MSKVDYLYDTALGYIESNAKITRKWRNPAYIIIEQPGIGKSLMFLVYILLQRLQVAKPVALYTCDPWYFLLDENGVTIHTEYDSRFPAPALMGSSKTVIIHATSPCKDHWHQWAKEYGARRFVMDGWKTKELAALSKGMLFTDKRVLQISSSRQQNRALHPGTLLG
ncbi:uncharacterized protein EDB91DRAFT_1245669 [Suillus paluster]|uniref:uncharacterized protein n=1 Tax=Suillus paluster TaxID=48578 RepID=UPI001B862ACA|nr:uncharacterized protein EDB91DRAFT_1245669 [Suillus paluster]KAG1747238.1 hypothetical protein EDB91DRAFT_1245669 [Suillus paluster]